MLVVVMSKSCFLTGCISVEGILHIKEIFTAKKFKYTLAWDGQHVFKKSQT